MSSTTPATPAVPFGIRGVNYSISSACATSAHCIGNAGELIQWGKQDIVFAGGGEELRLDPLGAVRRHGAMSTYYNEQLERASRAYDKDRDGFVMRGGAGVIVLEELSHAKVAAPRSMASSSAMARPPTATTWSSLGEGAARCMRQALSTVRERVDYINPHATSTPIGDLASRRCARCSATRCR